MDTNDHCKLFWSKLYTRLESGCSRLFRAKKKSQNPSLRNIGRKDHWAKDRVQTLSRDSLLCFQERHFTIAASTSLTQLGSFGVVITINPTDHLYWNRFVKHVSYSNESRQNSGFVRNVPGNNREGTVASWLMRSTPEQVVRVRALAGDIVLRSWNTPSRFMLQKPG